MVRFVSASSLTVCFFILNSFTSKLHAAILKSNLRPYNEKTIESYDQQQKGGYNFRLHLKDFQIIAIVGEDALSPGNDDYEEIEYNIPDEYLDSSVSSSTQTSLSTISNSSVTTVTSSSETSTQTSTTLTTPAQPPRKTVTIRITTPKPNITTKITTSPATPTITSASIPKTSTITRNNIENINQIPVVILQDSGRTANANDSINKKIVSTSVSIVSENDNTKDNDRPIALGEILQYKKCPVGYARDKAGRCRKIGRPQLPFDVSRFASNLATKFKRPVVTTSSSTNNKQN